ncbi:MAG TPA: response regulator [Candidatus Dormibacteraeota bacterium]|nr:response regulator [Candidatus Dormibacteraeota bacterium]
MNEPSTINRRLVLCIDDAPANLKVRKLLLEYAGFAVLTASSGKQGLDLFNTQPVDAVVVDYSMPEMDGGIVAARMKQERPQTPIIMLSAYPGARATVDETVDAFIEKGGDPQHFLGTLSSLINLRSHSHPELQSKYVLFVDGSRHCLDCSDAVCQLIGYSRADLLEKTIDDITYQREEAPALIDLYRQRGSLEGEFILKHRNGEPVPIRYRLWQFPDHCLAATWEPLTDWKELHRAALLELDPQAHKLRVEVALLAVHRRIRELGRSPGKLTQEWIALNDALNGLRALQKTAKRS